MCYITVEENVLICHGKDLSIEKLEKVSIQVNFLPVPIIYTHRETSRDAPLEFIVSTENLSVCLHL